MSLFFPVNQGIELKITNTFIFLFKDYFKSLKSNIICQALQPESVYFLFFFYINTSFYLDFWTCEILNIW